MQNRINIKSNFSKSPSQINNHAERMVKYSEIRKARYDLWRYKNATSTLNPNLKWEYAFSLN